MPYLSYGEWTVGIELREIGEWISLLSRTKNEYLNYKVEDIQGHYPSEAMRWLTKRDEDIDLIAPYSIEYDYRENRAHENWGIVRVVDTFEFPHTLASHKRCMVDEFKKAGKLYKGDQAVPRICGFGVTDSGEPEFAIQMARYYDQVGSNLSVDYPLPKPIEIKGETCTTTREWDMKQAGVNDCPPAFDHTRLANTIGVAVGILAKDKNGIVCPLKRKRSKVVAVYEGQWHVPFSFALAWKQGLKAGDELSLSELVLQDWGHELAEELHLEASDFSAPEPLVFCRDLVRGGKPQFFFKIQSKLTAEELRRCVGSDHAEYVGGPQKVDLLSNSHSPELLAFCLLTL